MSDDRSHNSPISHEVIALVKHRANIKVHTHVAQIVTSIRLCLNDADLESAPLDACKYQSN